MGETMFIKTILGFLSGEISLQKPKLKALVRKSGP